MLCDATCSPPADHTREDLRQALEARAVVADIKTTGVGRRRPPVDRRCIVAAAEAVGERPSLGLNSRIDRRSFAHKCIPQHQVHTRGRWKILRSEYL